MLFGNRHNKILRPNVTSLLGFISLNHSLEFPFTHAVHKPNSPHSSKVHTYKLLSCICTYILLELDQQIEKKNNCQGIYKLYIAEQHVGISIDGHFVHEDSAGMAVTFKNCHTGFMLFRLMLFWVKKLTSSTPK